MDFWQCLGPCNNKNTNNYDSSTSKNNKNNIYGINRNNINSDKNVTLERSSTIKIGVVRVNQGDAWCDGGIYHHGRQPTVRSVMLFG